jgi:hypothetical protein
MGQKIHLKLVHKLFKILMPIVQENLSRPNLFVIGFFIKILYYMKLLNGISLNYLFSKMV